MQFCAVAPSDFESKESKSVDSKEWNCSLIARVNNKQNATTNFDNNDDGDGILYPTTISSCAPNCQGTLVCRCVHRVLSAAWTGTASLEFGGFSLQISTTVP